jgi:enamine deaminase RidA (YjgF/YER057c/UK114 family)
MPRLPYSRACKKANVVYVSAHAAIDKNGEVVAPGDIKAQTRFILTDIVKMIEAAGGKKSDLMKCTVLLASNDYFEGLNEVFREFFGGSFPARTTIIGRLPGSHGEKLLVDIDAIAIL